jgi:hypothetical protein
MAVYDPPKPLWKRNLAGILDFLLAFVVFGFLASKVFGNQHVAPAVTPPGTTATELFGLGTWPSLSVLVLIILISSYSGARAAPSFNGFSA